MRLGVLIFASVLATPVSAQPVPLTERQIAAIHDAVREVVADASTLHFGNIVATKRGAFLWACGQVNQKNARGDMVPFYGIVSHFEGKDQFLLFPIGGNAAEFCRSVGLAF